MRSPFHELACYFLGFATLATAVYLFQVYLAP